MIDNDSWSGHFLYKQMNRILFLLMDKQNDNNHNSRDHIEGTRTLWRCKSTSPYYVVGVGNYSQR